MERKEKKVNKGKRWFRYLAGGIFTLALLSFASFSFSATYLDQPHPTDDISLLRSIPKIIHPGAGEQYVNGHIALDANAPAVGTSTNVYFNALNTSYRPSFFERAKGSIGKKPSFLASILDFWVSDGKVFIGLPFNAFNTSISGSEFDIPDPCSGATCSDSAGLWVHSFGDPLNPLTAIIQKVNIAGEGGARSSALAHQYQLAQRVCVDANGVLTLSCPSTSQTYQCQGTIPAHASLCSGDDQGLSQDTDYTVVSSCTAGTKCELVCDLGYHPENGKCEPDLTYHWEYGPWGACLASVIAHCEGSWTTQGSGICTGDGVEVTEDDSDACNGPCGQDEYRCEDYTDQTSCDNFDTLLSNNCSGDRGVVSCSGSCTWNSGNVRVETCARSNPTNQYDCEAQNEACTWVDTSGTRTRTVHCVDSTGTIVADSYCDGSSRPEETEACTPLTMTVTNEYRSGQNNCPSETYSHEEKTVDISGEANATVNYVVNMGGIGAIVKINGNPVSPGNGSFNLDSSGHAQIFMKAEGGPAKGSCGSSSDSYASFRIQEAFPQEVSVSGTGGKPTYCCSNQN